MCAILIFLVYDLDNLNLIIHTAYLFTVYYADVIYLRSTTSSSAILAHFRMYPPPPRTYRV